MTEAEDRFLRAYDILVLLLNRNNRPAAQNFALEVGAVADRYAAANKIVLAPTVSDAGTPATSRRAGGAPPTVRPATGE